MAFVFRWRLTALSRRRLSPVWLDSVSCSRDRKTGAIKSHPVSRDLDQMLGNGFVRSARDEKLEHPIYVHAVLVTSVGEFVARVWLFSPFLAGQIQGLV